MPDPAPAHALFSLGRRAALVAVACGGLGQRAVPAQAGSGVMGAVRRLVPAERDGGHSRGM